MERAVVAAGGSRVPYFFRTEDGAEIDLVFEWGGGHIAPGDDAPTGGRAVTGKVT